MMRKDTNTRIHSYDIRIMPHVHFIGVCGTAMAPIAKMMRDLGWRVTGSDKGIFPPMSDYLRRSGVEFYVGFHPEKIGNPKFAVVGNYIGPSNPEYISIKERNIPHKHYPEILSEFLIKPQSIVVAGTYGKTTTSALLAWIWEQGGLNPSFMSGGILKNFSDGTRNTDSIWSIVEGDEYPSSRWDPQPKFKHYSPTCLFLTGVEHDHVDVYPTLERYVETFKDLTGSMPPDGIIVAPLNRPNVDEVLRAARSRIEIIRYGRISYGEKSDEHPDRYFLKVFEPENGKTKISIYGPEGVIINEKSISMLGDESLDHIAGVVALAHVKGIPADTIARALESFQGVRRRLEVRDVVNGVTVIDDFGHSPGKAKASLNAVRRSFPHARYIIAVFEPNLGSRITSDATHALYDETFDNAHIVIIPRLSIAKQGEGGGERMDGQGLKNRIDFWSMKNQTGTQTIYEPDDTALLARIKKIARPGDVVVFMGSHGFRGMIEQTLAVFAHRS